MAASLLQQIQQGCDDLALTLSEQQQQQLLDYVVLLGKWNKVYNLTSVRDIDEMVSRHLLDSLAILPYLSGVSLLDVGSGGGLPGIPLSIARPDLAVTLLDSNSKKTRFLQQVKAELGLDNVTVVHVNFAHFQKLLGYGLQLVRPQFLVTLDEFQHIHLRSTTHVDFRPFIIISLASKPLDFKFGRLSEEATQDSFLSTQL